MVINIYSCPVIELVVGRVFYDASTMPIIRHIIEIFVHLVTTSKFVFWSKFQSRSNGIFDKFGPNKFVF
jgi:hypothetical protein